MQRLLLSAGAEVNAVGDMGETPLHIAVRRGQPRVVELLLAYGADINVGSEFGPTPTSPLISRRNLEHANRLYGHGIQMHRDHARCIHDLLQEKSIAYRDRRSSAAFEINAQPLFAGGFLIYPFHPYAAGVILDHLFHRP